MKSLLFLLAFFMLPTNVLAQYSYAKSKEFEAIKNRPLIVEILELDERLIEKWEKKKSKSKKAEDVAEHQYKIDKYLAFITDYNILVKKAVENHWKINPTVIYKTTSEVNEMMKNDSEEYTVLWYSETNSKKRDAHMRTYFPNLTVPTLNYSRIEKGRNKTDYCYFINYTHNRNDQIKYTDFVLSFKLMKQHINYIVKEGKKKYDFYKYITDQAEENCKNFSGKTVFVQDESVHKKSSLSVINNIYSGEIMTLTDKEISKAIEDDEDRIVGFFFPFSIITGGIGPVSKGRIQYTRSFINIKTGKVFTSRGNKMGQLFDAYFRENEFKKYDKCK